VSGARGLVLALAAGCSVLSAPPKPSFHYLTLSPQGAGAATAAPRGAVVLEPLELPGYLDGVELVVRKSDDEIERSSIDRWAEPLAAALTRTLAADLDGALASAQLTVRGRADAAAIAVSVAVDRFEQRADGEAELIARFTVRAIAGAATRRGQIHERVPLAAADRGGPAVAAALSRAVGKLAAALATEIAMIAAAPPG
jgi:uncharacterized lipoprotein YmbA